MCLCTLFHPAQDSLSFLHLLSSKNMQRRSGGQCRVGQENKAGVGLRHLNTSWTCSKGESEKRNCYGELFLFIFVCLCLSEAIEYSGIECDVI